eukprot:gb/GEZN01002792.1/.p1 GENE.gb/GEZN01002792.1/~~gb/GEZN01002792.1/.p1  ORF type:complete len:466 (-),score=17.04 gb/GEZN01002792.1/:850-2247(-)
MSGLDYVRLGEDVVQPVSLVFKFVKVATGLVGLGVTGAAGWLVRGSSGPGLFAGSGGSGWLDGEAESTRLAKLVINPFEPKDGIPKVLVREKPGPAPLGILQALGVSTDYPKCLFAYGTVGVALLATAREELKDGLNTWQGLVYGVKLSMTPIRHKTLAGEDCLLPNLAYPTGRRGNTIRGSVLCWSDSRSVEKALLLADELYSYNPDTPDEGLVRQGKLFVVHKDGTSMQAYWYFVASASERPRIDEKDGLDNSENRSSDFVCTLCGKTFRKAAYLTSHCRTHSGEKPFKCEHCDKAFAQPGNLKVHVRKHTGEKPYQCPYCEKSFYQSSHLTYHVRAHTGDRPFQCTLCGQSFYQSSHLATHLDTHAGNRPFECERCSKSFAQRGALNVHMRSHTGEKPFTCQTCNKSFSTASNLRTHMVIHTGIKSWICSECQKSFFRKAQLQMHMKTHKSGDDINGKNEES